MMVYIVTNIIEKTIIADFDEFFVSVQANKKVCYC